MLTGRACSRRPTKDRCAPELPRPPSAAVPLAGAPGRGPAGGPAGRHQRAEGGGARTAVQRWDGLPPKQQRFPLTSLPLFAPRPRWCQSAWAPARWRGGSGAAVGSTAGDALKGASRLQPKHAAQQGRQLCRATCQRQRTRPLGEMGGPGEAGSGAMPGLEEGPSRGGASPGSSSARCRRADVLARSSCCVWGGGRGWRAGGEHRKT